MAHARRFFFNIGRIRKKWAPPTFFFFGEAEKGPPGLSCVAERAANSVESKMSKSEFITRMTERIEPVAGDLGLRLVDLEFASAGKHSVLRVFLDQEGGIGLEALARASREIEAVLDAYDDVPGVYSLECSSPGVNRRLKGLPDFEAHIGMQVRLRTLEPIDGSRNFRGELVRAGEGGIELAVSEGPAVQIPLAAIEKANYEHDFDRDLRERHAQEA